MINFLSGGLRPRGPPRTRTGRASLKIALMKNRPLFLVCEQFPSKTFSLSSKTCKKCWPRTPLTRGSLANWKSVSGWRGTPWPGGPWRMFFQCIHVNMYTCMHVYMYTCIHVYMHTCIHAYMHTRIHVYTHTRIHVYIYKCIHVYMYMCIHVYICTCKQKH